MDLNNTKEKNTRHIIEVAVVAFVTAYGIHYLGYFLRVRYFNFTDALGLGETGSHVIMYTGHIIFLALWLLYALAVRRDRKYVLSFIPRKGNRDLLWLLLGACVGLALMGCCILAASLHGDITVSFRGLKGSWGIFMLGLLVVFVQASTEEIESRGFLFGKMKGEGVPVAAAVLISSFFFAYLHAANPGFGIVPMISVFSVGIFYAVSFHYFRSLWFSCGAHTLWNFSQDFIFGLPDSGKPAAISIMDTTVNGGGFFYDPEFGIEGSFMAIGMNLLACVVVLIIGKTRKARLASLK